MQINLVTGNESKFKEAAQIIANNLTNVELIQKDLNLNEIKSFDQEKIVIDKARQAFSLLKEPVIVDDTGIYFEEYGNFPGTFTKFTFDAIGFEGIKRLLKGKNRKSYFKTLICYKDAEDTEKVFSGTWEGEIIDLGKGKFNPDWQYNNIFLPLDSDKVLSEIGIEERAKKSHRKKACDKLIKFLKKKTQNERN